MKRTLAYFRIDRYWLLTMIFLAVKLALHFATNTNYELLRDEMLFFNMGDHLSAGYATVPPVTGFLAWLMKAVFGYSVFGIRLFPALMGAGCLLIISALVRELGGSITALSIAATGYILAPGFLLTGTLFTPNSMEELIWLATAFCIFRIVNSGNRKLWICVGLLTGIGFLNKYSILFLVAGYLPALLISRHRALLFSRWFVLSVIIAVALSLPNIVWQYNHGWPVFLHMGELKSSQLDNFVLTDFPVSLFSFSQGSAIIWLAGLVFLLFSRPEKANSYAGVASLVVLFLFFLLKGKGYYALVVVPFLLAYGAYVIEKYLAGRRAYLGYVLVSFSVLLSLAALPSGLPLLSYEAYSNYVQKTRKFVVHPLLYWDNGTSHNISQAWADMTGWEELAAYVAEAYDSLTAEEEETCTIYGERDYGYAGAVYFYGNKYGLPEAVTFHESYVFWAPDSIPGGPLIYIYSDINGLDRLFAEITEIGSVDNPYFREKGLKVFLCRKPLTDTGAVYREVAINEKARYSRQKKEG